MALKWSLRNVYGMKPGLDVEFLGASLRTNAGGWREGPIAMPKPKDTIRIVGIGDSHMFGWAVEADEGYVIRPAAQGEGLVVEVHDAGATTELGRTTSLAGASRTGSEATLLLHDGRLFRGAFRGGRAPGFELTGWEVAGAYLRAEPEDGDWKLRRTPAGASLEDEPAILLLFGAIVADLPRSRTAASEDL